MGKPNWELTKKRDARILQIFLGIGRFSEVVAAKRTSIFLGNFLSPLRGWKSIYER